MKSDIVIRRVIDLVSLALLTMLVGSEPVLASPGECRGDQEYVTDIGRRSEIGKRLAPGIDRISFGNSSYHVRYFRLLIESTALSDVEWQLAIRDEQGRPLQYFGPDDFRDTRKRWSRRLPGDFAYLDLLSNAGRSEYPITIISAIEMPQVVVNPYYSVQDPNNVRYAPLYDETTSANRLILLGDYVGFLTTSYGAHAWSCSGVIVANDIFLTNWHCGGTPTLAADGYWNAQVCDSTIIDLSWDGDVLSREYTCASVLHKDAERDFALLRIASVSGAEKLRVAPMRLDFNSQSGDEIHVVHHPLGKEKQFTTDCEVAETSRPGWVEGAEGIDFSHDCDTEGGSSGAPVFNARRQLIGIHHAGFELDPETCKQMDRVNKAVRIDAILDSLPRELQQEIIPEKAR